MKHVINHGIISLTILTGTSSFALTAQAAHHKTEAAWPTFQNNAQRTGSVQRPEIKKPKVRWRKK